MTTATQRTEYAGQRPGTGVQVRGLTRRFGDVTAVDDVTFDVPAARMTGFVGGNGAGKTTTMRMIMGVLGIHAGEVAWEGRPVTDVDRTSFGYMPEERGLYPKQKVVDQLVYLAQLKGMAASEARTVAMELLERFRLADRAKDHVEKLSLGNQQRVQIIAAVLSRPQALILDEPFSGLDPGAVDEMGDLLREYTAQGVPVLFSSHQLELVDRLCDRLVIMAAGRVRAEGTPAELRAGAARRYRLRLGGDAGWVHGFRPGAGGLRVVGVDGSEALLEVDEDHSGAAEEAIIQQLLTEAMGHGSVHELALVVPPLSEIYREATR